MLLFSSASFTVNGVTVFPDHANPNQFWYLPSPVSLAKMPDSEEPQFLLTMYAPDIASTGIKGVGFLNLTLALTLSDATREDIIGQIGAHFPDASNPLLTPVPFDEGTVQIVALDLQGSGGTSGAPLRDGEFEAVEKILGATAPELFGDNNAIFALTLSEEGASILEQAFEDDMAPVGGLYSLKFTGVRPALDVKITADLKKAYDSFSVGLTGQVYWISAGIDATFEKLKQDGAIKVEVVNLTTDQENRDKEQWALNLFKDQLLQQWFSPSLTPPGAAAASTSVPPPRTTTGSPTPAPSVTTPPRPTPAPAPAGGGMSSPGASGMGGGSRSGGASGGTSGGGTSGGMSGSGASGGTSGGGTSGGMSSGGASGGMSGGGTSGGSRSGGASGGTSGGGTSGGSSSGGTIGGAASSLANALATAARSSSAASPFGVSLRLRYVHQEELKTVSVAYNRMDAVQRTYAPQGYFGLMLSKIDKTKHFLKVDGTDPFFTKFAVTIDPPKDFASIGLLTAHVAIDYGDPTDPSHLKHGEFIFDAHNQTRQVWEVFEGLITDTAFRYTADYKFDPESGWEGEQTSYTLPTVTTENRDLTLDPHDFLGFRQISVMPGQINADLVDRIDVFLDYTAKNGWHTSTTVSVKADSKPQDWRLRLADKGDVTYSYSTACFLKDGRSFKSGPISTTTSAIIISDPFVGALNLIFQPALDPSKTKLAAVEVDYTDAANDYSFSTSLQMPGGTTTPAKVHIPLINRANDQYRYRVILIGTGNQRSDGGYITVRDPFVLVSDSPAT